ncbi:hypothetical protein ACI48J_02245 [Paenibacillus chitinolyticus]
MEKRRHLLEHADPYGGQIVKPPRSLFAPTGFMPVHSADAPSAGRK